MLMEDGVEHLGGDLTLANASRLLAESATALDENARAFDLSGIGQVDSSALSLLLSIRRRRADAEFRNIPDSLLSLAKLYGVAELI